ncbi:MAG TPA: hypothetical protein DCR97_12240 [Deltaproteobacteria bacterium]|nr:hypothetical protein [Deltaproteobacteria bacterium]
MWHRRETSRKTEKTKIDLKPPIGLRCRQRHLTAMQKSAEGIVGGVKQTSVFGSMDEIGTRPAIERAGGGNSRPKRKKIDVMPPLKA